MAEDFCLITLAGSIRSSPRENKLAAPRTDLRPLPVPVSHFDTLVYDVGTLDFLRKKVGAEHLLLGTDFPYKLGDWMGVDKVEALPCSEKEKLAILEGNARKLLKIPAG